MDIIDTSIGSKLCSIFRGMEVMGPSRSHTPDIDRERNGNAVSPSPTMQQRIKAIGVPTPIALSSPLRR